MYEYHEANRSFLHLLSKQFNFGDQWHMELGWQKTLWNSPGVHGTDFVADSVPRLGTLLARFVADF